MIANIDPIALAEISLGTIERQAKQLAEASNELDTTLAQYEADLQALNAKYLRPLKRHVAATASAQAGLHDLIERAPHLFNKPRTITVHGIKLGYTTSKGKLVFDDEATAVSLLKKKFPDLRDTLINTTEKVNKDGVKALKLDDEQLAKLGMAIEGAGDTILIDRAGGEIEKLMAKLKDKLVEALA